MQIAIGAGDGDLGVSESPQEGGDRRAVLVPLPGVANEGEIGFELLGMRIEEGRQRRAAQFLLALQEHGHVDRQPPLGLEPGAAGLDEGHELALVVGGAAGDDHWAITRILGETRREGRSAPGLQRVRRLHVVMAVEEDARARARARMAPMADDHRLARGRAHACLEADLAQRGRAPFGRGKAIGGKGGVGGDAGNGKQFE